MQIQLRQFSPGNASLEYIEKRVLDDNYRGDVSSQHNRWTFDELLFVLNLLHTRSDPEGFLAIRTADKSRRPQNIASEVDFAIFCDEVVAGIGKGTQDAMRKNWFVDWHRAGWLERFTAAKQAIGPYERSAVAFVRLSDEGKKLLDVSRSRTDKYFIFSKGLDLLYLGMINVLLDLYREFDIRTIDIHEYTFFVTAISTDSSFKLTRSEAVELIKSWRQLTPLTRQQIDSYLSKTLVPDPNAASKVPQRDFHNWINKTQQTFFLLKQTIYFEQVDHRTSPHLTRLYYLGDDIQTDDGFVPRNQTRLNRSLQEKHGYFREHSAEKKLGFELHHVVALTWAESQYEFKLLDNWKNMIYIDAFSHAQITQNRNRNVKMSSSGDSVIDLSDFSGNVVSLVRPTNAIYDVAKLPTMLAYNSQLLATRQDLLQGIGQES